MWPNFGKWIQITSLYLIISHTTTWTILCFPNYFLILWGLQNWNYLVKEILWKYIHIMIWNSFKYTKKCTELHLWFGFIIQNLVTNVHVYKMKELKWTSKGSTSFSRVPSCSYLFSLIVLFWTSFSSIPSCSSPYQITWGYMDMISVYIKWIFHISWWSP